MWTLESGVEFCRTIEPKLCAIGYHCAIGGSVLHRGQSDKDLDVFIYPHKTTKIVQEEALVEHLGKIVGSMLELRDHKIYGDNKRVFSCQIEAGRVDFFLL